MVLICHYSYKYDKYSYNNHYTITDELNVIIDQIKKDFQIAQNNKLKKFEIIWFHDVISNEQFVPEINKIQIICENDIDNYFVGHSDTNYIYDIDKHKLYIYTKESQYLYTSVTPDCKWIDINYYF